MAYDRARLTLCADDAAEATRKARGDYPGQDKEAKKAGEEAYETARAKAQQLVSLIYIFEDMMCR